MEKNKFIISKWGFPNEGLLIVEKEGIREILFESCMQWAKNKDVTSLDLLLGV